MDLGFEPDDTTSLSNEAADAYIDEAGESYTDPRSAHAYSRVIALERLTMQAASSTSYTQNNTREEASDLFKHLMQLLSYWRKKLDDAIAIVDEAARPSAARFGRTTRKPARIKEHPGGNGWGYWGW